MSQHFPPREFTCHSGVAYPKQWLTTRFVDLTDNTLEIIRSKWTFPLVVVSGYRTPAYNKQISGAPHSLHPEGMAADIRPMRLSDLGRLNVIIEGLIKDGKLPKVGGLGIYTGWIHIDVRNKVTNSGKIVRWFGKGIGSEPLIVSAGEKKHDES